jgi:L-2,4-diaminobutyrate decarboxylase
MTDDASHRIHPDHRVDRELLARAIDQLERSRAPRARPVPIDPPLELPDALPEAGLGEREALERLAAAALDGSAQLHHPGYLAHMDPPTPAVTWAAALWQAAANQNMLHPDAAPAARSLERRVVEWLVPSFAMDGGHLVPGSTIGNLTALWAAREIAGVTRVVASSRAHLSIKKAADLLGLEYEAVPSDSGHCLPLERLPELTGSALVLTAGTVSTGAIDPLERLPAAWIHVDAAWAGPLRLSRRHAHLLDGIENADSVGFSAHKWLYQPKGAAVVMFRDAAAAHQAMTYGAGYLAAPNVGLLGSAPAVALPLAATLLAWGRKGVAERLEADMARADRLVALIEGDDRFELWGPNRCGVVVWRPRRVGVAELRDRMTEAWVSLTDLDGDVWLRSVAANPAADPDHVFARVIAAL